MGLAWDKTVINHIFGEVNCALKRMAKTPNPPHVYPMKEIIPEGPIGGALALRTHCTRTARYFLDLKSPQAHPFQTPLYHPCLRSMSHCRPWETSFSGGGMTAWYVLARSSP